MKTHTSSIIGIGAVTGYGWTREDLWDGLASGKPAAELVDGHGENLDETVWISRVPSGGSEADGSSRSARAMMSAVREAIADGRERGWEPGPRTGFIHAVVLPEAEQWRDFYVEDGARRSVRDYLTLMPSTAVSKLMKEFDFHGPAMNLSAMCTSGNAGLLTAKMWIDAGMADDVVFVSTDLSATPENVEHFVKLGVAVVDAEPLDACRPFQEGSRGFPVGEASVAFIVTGNAAGSDDARPYLHVLGGAMSHDGYHLTSIDPEMTHVDRCVRDALANADVDAADVRYINAHGPGTAQCDRTEAAVLDTIFASAPQIFSVKPLVGHCQGAAAAVEIASAAMGFEHGVIPAPRSVAPGHARLLDGPTAVEPGLMLKSSLGMGGHNSALILAPA